jgi:hypothetical protein
MKPVRAVLSAAEGLLDRILCVAGAVIFSQVPEFMQQYLQRLGGHLDEARRQLQQFQDVAARSGLTLDQLIAQTNAGSDPAVSKLGGVMSATVTRVNELAAAQSALEHATLWDRPFVFLHQVDPAIARATWAIFRPAVPTTPEGLVYALVGILVLLATYHGGVKYPIARARARRAAEKAAPDMTARR